MLKDQENNSPPSDDDLDDYAACDNPDKNLLIQNEDDHSVNNLIAPPVTNQKQPERPLLHQP